MNIIQKLKNKFTTYQHNLLVAKTMPSIEKYEGIDGFLFPEEAVALYHLASLLPKNSTIVEIGSWKGKSTYCLAKGLKTGKVFAIDPFDASGDDSSMEIYNQMKGEIPLIQQFEEKMTQLDVIDKIETLAGFSHQFVNKFKQIDLLFIDGDHSIKGCQYDFDHYSPLIPSGGYIALHDYSPLRKDLGPTWVIENKIIPSKEYKFIDLFNSLWIGRKV